MLDKSNNSFDSFQVKGSELNRRMKSKDKLPQIDNNNKINKDCSMFADNINNISAIDKEFTNEKKMNDSLIDKKELQNMFNNSSLIDLDSTESSIKLKDIYKKMNMKEELDEFEFKMYQERKDYIKNQLKYESDDQKRVLDMDRKEMQFKLEQELQKRLECYMKESIEQQKRFLAMEQQLKDHVSMQEAIFNEIEHDIDIIIDDRLSKKYYCNQLSIFKYYILYGDQQDQVKYKKKISGVTKRIEHAKLIFQNGDFRTSISMMNKLKSSLVA